MYTIRVLMRICICPMKNLIQGESNIPFCPIAIEISINYKHKRSGVSKNSASPRYIELNIDLKCLFEGIYLHYGYLSKFYTYPNDDIYDTTGPSNYPEFVFD